MATPCLSGEDVDLKRQELKAYFNHTWHTYESLFALINHDEAYFLRPERLRHPLIFYFGHTATFYINKLILGKFIDKRINTHLEAICAVGVDEMSWDDLDPTHYEWPSVDEVKLYREKVQALVNQLIDRMELTLPITQNSLAWIILMGCEHERIHLETSSVIMRMLPLSYLSTNNNWQTCSIDHSPPSNGLINVPAQEVILGKPNDDLTFGWDNEYGCQIQQLASFKASKYLVSNQEYMTFVDAGGYQNTRYWSDEGKKWLAFSQARMPRFWRYENGQYFQRNLLNEIPLPLSWPVEINYLEAKAFCEWKSQKTGKYIHLPTEAQWHALNKSATHISKTIENGNINLNHFASSCPVDLFQQGDFYDVSGNVWQWSESAIDGFDGFKVHPLYDDFSTPTFDGQHNLIKGGSWISTGNEILTSSRYAFRRHFFQHAGFRYVENTMSEPPIIPLNPYETDPKVCESLNSHYGEPLLGFSSYALALSALIKKQISQLPIHKGKLLDLGCKVGRVSFELSNYFSSIDAVDFSAAPINHAVQLQQGKEVRYVVKREGEIVEFKKISPLPENIRMNENLFFTQGDANNLKAKYQGYDVILTQHILEACDDPKLFLQDVTRRLNPDGVLIMLTDYGIDANTKNKGMWLGGRKVNGENLTGFEALSNILTPNFNLLHDEEITQVISLDERHFNVTKNHFTLWQKR